MPRAHRATFASLAAVAAVVAGGCGRSGREPATATAGSAAAAPVAPGVGAAVAAGGAFVTQVSALRREPTETARVKGPSGKEVPNGLATLQRGERVTLLEPREEWARVRASDDREGWMRRSTLLEGDGIVEATVLQPADVFDRPDLLAANARRKIEAGTLVLVLRSRPPFAEVNVPGAAGAWVLAERLATGEREVLVAKLCEKARWLVRAGRKDEAVQVLALARDNFAGVPLVEVLAAELGEAPTPGAVPAAATVPGTSIPVPGAAPPPNP